MLSFPMLLQRPAGAALTTGENTRHRAGGLAQPRRVAGSLVRPCLASRAPAPPAGCLTETGQRLAQCRTLLLAARVAPGEAALRVRTAQASPGGGKRNNQ